MDQWSDIEKTLALISKQNTATIADEQGPVAVGGTMELWNGRHMGWAFIGARARKLPFTLTRLCRKILGRVNGRIEASARADLEDDVRWLEVLGFKGGAMLPAYGPDGSDHRGFALYIKGD